MTWLHALSERGQVPWLPLGTAQLATGVALLVLLMGLTRAGDGFIPLLDHANLAFHEAGHPIFGLLGEAPGLYGGTLGQLIFPLVFIGRFWWQRHALGFSLSLAWLFENGFNIARYMADARAQELPLVGGGEHDWYHILSRWGMLERDVALAGTLRLLCWMGLLATLGWLVWRYLKDKEQ